MRIETVDAKGERVVVCAPDRESEGLNGYHTSFAGNVSFTQTLPCASGRSTRESALREAIALSPFNPENR